MNTDQGRASFVLAPVSNLILVARDTPLLPNPSGTALAVARDGLWLLTNLVDDAHGIGQPGDKNFTGKEILFTASEAGKGKGISYADITPGCDAADAWINNTTLLCTMNDHLGDPLKNWLGIVPARPGQQITPTRLLPISDYPPVSAVVSPDRTTIAFYALVAGKLGLYTASPQTPGAEPTKIIDVANSAGDLLEWR